MKERERVNEDRENQMSLRLLPKLKEGQVPNRPEILDSISDPVTYMQFLTYDAGLGNRAHLKGKKLSRYCPFCIKRLKVERQNDPHIMSCCEEMEEQQDLLGFKEYKDLLGGTAEELEISGKNLSI